MTPEDIAHITAIVAAAEERIVQALAAAIRAEIKAINARIEDVEQRLNARIEDVEQRLNERIEHVETSLLTEFHKWASPAEMRARTHAAALRAIDAEMEYLSDRVSKLEGKPPQ